MNKTTSPSTDSWQADYVAEYKRTTGNDASFGSVKPGGWVELTTVHPGDTPPKHTTTVRRSQVVEMTARLKARPSAPIDARIPVASRRARNP